LALEGWEASSSASRASRSAFLRAASAFLASADSLYRTNTLDDVALYVFVSKDRLTS